VSFAALAWPLVMSRWLLSDFYVGLAVLSFVLVLVSFWSFRDQLTTWFPSDFRAFGKGLGLGIVAGSLQAFFTHVGYELIAPRVPLIKQEVVALYELMNTGMGPFKALPIVILAISVEEIMWRGVAFPQSTPTTKWKMGVYACLSAGSYSLAQAGSGSYALAITAFVCGGLWWGARIWGGSLITPLTMHLLWSLVVLVYFPLEDVG